MAGLLLLSVVASASPPAVAGEAMWNMWMCFLALTAKSIKSCTPACALLYCPHSQMSGFHQGSFQTQNISVPTNFLTPLPTTTASAFLFQYQNGSVPLQLQAQIAGRVNIWGITSPKATVSPLPASVARVSS